MGIWDKLTGKKIKETLETLNVRSGIRKKKLEESTHSSYWLGAEAEEVYKIDLSDKGASFESASKLSSIRRSIANFVHILTGRNDILVKYSSGQQSMTDGKTVIISADTSKKVFDSTVGLALHEASHILLSDFGYVKAICGESLSKAKLFIPADIFSRGAQIGMTDMQVAVFFKDVVNILEDRRIDYFIYKTAPGYRPYYEALYNTYFNDPQIDAALALGTKTNSVVDDYLFQLVNMTNGLFNPSAMKGLDEIAKLVDLRNILRLMDDKDGYKFFNKCLNYGQTVDQNMMPKMHQLAVAVARIILANSTKFSGESQQKQQQQQSGQSGQGQSGEEQDKLDNLDQSSGGGAGKGESKEGDDEEGDEEEGDGEGDDEGDEEGDKDGKGEGDSDSDKESDKESDGDSKSDKKKDGKDGKDGKDSKNQKDQGKDGKDGKKDKKSKEQKQREKLERKLNPKKLQKAIQKQKDFISGNIHKKQLNKEEQDMVTTVEEAGATYYEAGEGDIFGNVKAPVVVMPRITNRMIENAPARINIITRSTNSYAVQGVKDGFRMGAVLASRLVVRNMERVTHYTRQDKGRIDHRLVADLGRDADAVFFHDVIDAYDPVDLHISIDASGSMSGEKWRKVIAVGVAVAVAATKIQNLRVVISLRTGLGGKGEALIAIVYDSAVDNLGKIRTLFPHLNNNGSTPEGLAFEAISNLIADLRKNRKKYFLNLSDGMPYHYYNSGDGRSLNYEGENAARHTAAQMRKFRDCGVEILSYFITDRHGAGDSRVSDLFRTMYGRGAKTIDVNNITSLVQTLNDLFLDKGGDR